MLFPSVGLSVPVEKLGETNFRESDWFDVDDIHGLRIVAGVTVKIPAETLSA